MINQISVQTLKALKKDKNIQVIDVRESGEYASGHVPGAINMPLSLLPYTFQDLKKDQPYYIICQSGARSMRACQFLDQQGYQVTNVIGGTQAWPDPLDH
ncbi:TPA: rhodanese-like domain-containing protein [Streptococcus suis]